MREVEDGVPVFLTKVVVDPAADAEYPRADQSTESAVKLFSATTDVAFQREAHRTQGRIDDVFVDTEASITGEVVVGAEGAKTQSTIGQNLERLSHGMYGLQAAHLIALRGCGLSNGSVRRRTRHTKTQEKDNVAALLYSGQCFPTAYHHT
jgi:hypothetical protein